MGLQDRDYMRRPRKKDDRPHYLSHMRPPAKGSSSEQYFAYRPPISWKSRLHSAKKWFVSAAAVIAVASAGVWLALPVDSRRR